MSTVSMRCRGGVEGVGGVECRGCRAMSMCFDSLDTTRGLPLSRSLDTSVGVSGLSVGLVSVDTSVGSVGRCRAVSGSSVGVSSRGSSLAGLEGLGRSRPVSAGLGRSRAVSSGLKRSQAVSKCSLAPLEAFECSVRSSFQLQRYTGCPGYERPSNAPLMSNSCQASTCASAASKILDFWANVTG